MRKTASNVNVNSTFGFIKALFFCNAQERNI